MIKPLSLFILLITSQIAFSGEGVFSFTIEQYNYSQNFENITKMIDATQQTSLDANITNYTQSSPVTIAVIARNKNATITYGTTSALTFSMTDCDIPKETFDIGPGSTRAQNEAKFRTFLNDHHDQILNCVNENGTVGGEYDWPLPDTTPDDNEPGIGVALSVGHYSIGNQKHNVLTLPLSYTHYFEEKGRKLKITAPISFIDINGSKVYKVAVGAAYTRPVNDKWTVIPAMRLGITASDDMALGATTVAATLTNQYEFPYHNKHVTLSNTVGVLTSLNYSLGQFDSYYDVDNQIIKNGISVEYPLSYKMLGGKTSMEFSLANTQFFGTKVFVDNYTDIAVSMGTRRKVGGKDNSQDSMHLGLTYTIGNKGYKGGKINFGYKF